MLNAKKKKCLEFVCLHLHIMKERFLCFYLSNVNEKETNKCNLANGNCVDIDILNVGDKCRQHVYFFFSKCRQIALYYQCCDFAYKYMYRFGEAAYLMRVLQNGGICFHNQMM